MAESTPATHSGEPSDLCAICDEPYDGRPHEHEEFPDYEDAVSGVTASGEPKGEDTRRWNFWVCPKCGRAGEHRGSCGGCEVWLELVTVVPASALAQALEERDEARQRAKVWATRHTNALSDDERYRVGYVIGREHGAESAEQREQAALAENEKLSKDVEILTRWITEACCEMSTEQVEAVGRALTTEERA